MIEGLIAGLLAAAASAFVTPFFEPTMRIGTILTWPAWRGFRNHPFYFIGIIVSIALVVAINILIGGITDDEKVRAVRSVEGVRVGITILNAMMGFFIIPGFLYFRRLLVERLYPSASEITLYQAVITLPTSDERIKRARLFLQAGLIPPETYDRWSPLLEDDE